MYVEILLPNRESVSRGRSSTVRLCDEKLDEHLVALAEDVSPISREDTVDLTHALEAFGEFVYRQLWLTIMAERDDMASS